MPPLAPPGWESDSNFPLFWWTWNFWDLLVRYFGNVPQRGFAGYLLKTGVVNFWEISEAECCSHSVTSEVSLDARHDLWLLSWSWPPAWGRVCQFPVLDCSFPPHSVLMRGRSLWAPHAYEAEGTALQLFELTSASTFGMHSVILRLLIFVDLFSSCVLVFCLLKYVCIVCAFRGSRAR